MYTCINLHIHACTDLHNAELEPSSSSKFVFDQVRALHALCYPYATYATPCYWCYNQGCVVSHCYPMHPIVSSTSANVCNCSCNGGHLSRSCWIMRRIWKTFVCNWITCMCTWNVYSDVIIRWLVWTQRSDWRETAIIDMVTLSPQALSAYALQCVWSF